MMNAEPRGKHDDSWPRVLRISQSDEFQQSVAVARLAVKLCTLQKRELQNKWEAEDKKYAHEIQTAVTESDKKRLDLQRGEQMKSRIKILDPKAFLEPAWELIQSARECVLRPQTDVELLVQNDGNQGVAKVLNRKDRASRVSFEKLCDPERKNKDDTLRVHGVTWKVYRSEAGFDNLFLRYWRDIGERWKNGDQEIGTMLEFKTKGKQRRINFYSDKDRKGMRFRARMSSRSRGWNARGQNLLESWKRDGLPRTQFLALAEFRRAHDKRAANLKRSEVQAGP